MNEQMGLLGRKLGMTQLFEDDGTVVPVTVIQCGPCTVLRVKTEESADGYNAVQLGYGNRKKGNKPLAGQLAAAGIDHTPQDIAEIRVPKEAASQHEVGSSVGADIFTAGQRVDVTGISKGRGFSGVMRRHNFSGFERTHGVHEFFRHGGSIGTRLTPGHVLKGKKMPGQMGNERVTVQNLVVARVDTERNLVFVRGGVPGPTGGSVTVRHAVKAG